MKKITFEELKEKLNNRTKNETLDLRDAAFDSMDLRGFPLDHIDFTSCRFHKVCFDCADMRYTSIAHALCEECTFRNTDLRYADMRGAAMRYNDLSGADIRYANLFSAVLEHAKLEGILSNNETKFFKLHCPEKGAFLGYKKCFNDRLVQLLIPADAKRTSATLSSCRCSKAKVLTIKSFDYQEEFDEAWSLVNEDFVYRKGQWVEVSDFDEDRWNDSTTGIHFWLTREEAKNY